MRILFSLQIDHIILVINLENSWCELMQFNFGGMNRYLSMCDIFE